MSGPVLSLPQIKLWKDEGPDLCSEIRPVPHSHSLIDVDNEINSLVSILRYGDSTKIQCDAIISRSNNNFTNGGFLFRSINEAAGPELAEECRKIGRCDDLNTVITPGFNLPSKYIIHTVGPTGDADDELEKTLDSIFAHIDGVQIRSIAMTSFFIENNAFSLRHAATIVLQHTRNFLANEENRRKVDRIIFIDSEAENFKILVQLMYLFFPLEGIETESDTFENYEIEEEEEEEYSYIENDNLMLLFNNNDSGKSYPQSPVSSDYDGFSITF